MLISVFDNAFPLHRDEDGRGVAVVLMRGALPLLLDPLAEELDPVVVGDAMRGVGEQLLGVAVLLLELVEEGAAFRFTVAKEKNNKNVNQLSLMIMMTFVRRRCRNSFHPLCVSDTGRNQKTCCSRQRAK